jgi:hypothetical protein
VYKKVDELGPSLKPKWLQNSKEICKTIGFTSISKNKIKNDFQNHIG